eukprot:m.470115 g.470115  ORF g.470115 m.470115 type:complete len:62 (-) comp21651_c0_seq13:45-230(-)
MGPQQSNQGLSQRQDTCDKQRTMHTLQQHTFRKTSPPKFKQLTPHSPNSCFVWRHANLNMH